MSTKTFVPAFRAGVGDWVYYVSVMKYAQVAREVEFAHELGGNKDLNTLIQRGIGDRTEGIRDYLLQSSHRFLGALIVATWGGDPEYLELQMEDAEGVLKGVDNGFGVLTFDGSQQYFALDGQHRLRAIKDAVKLRPELGSEDICVLLVSHYDTPDGRERTQRLFTNINRNAKNTTAAENIALDVDDAFAITTRRLLTEHPFFSAPGRVRVFTKAPTPEGQFTLAGTQVPPGDKAALTTITVLYDLLRVLSWQLPNEIKDRQNRPSDDVLKSVYTELSGRLDQLFKACGDVSGLLCSVSNAKDLRVPKGNESTGHPMMRPVIQKAVARALQTVIQQDLLSWQASLDRLSALNWQLGAAPWTAVYNSSTNNMITAKENADLLEDLVRVTLAPSSKADIRRARDSYRNIRQTSYPISQADLEVAIVGAPA
jgi:DNA sulfur modification protein DndB